MHLPSHHEHRLEAKAVLPSTILFVGLRAFPHTADSSYILQGEAALVTLDHYFPRINLEGDRRVNRLRLDLCVLIIVGILEKLENENIVASVQILH